MYDHWQSILDSTSWSLLLMPPVWAIQSKVQGNVEQKAVRNRNWSREAWKNLVRRLVLRTYRAGLLKVSGPLFQGGPKSFDEKPLMFFGHLNWIGFKVGDDCSATGFNARNKKTTRGQALGSASGRSHSLFSGWAERLPDSPRRAIKAHLKPISRQSLTPHIRFESLVNSPIDANLLLTPCGTAWLLKCWM